MKELGAYLFNWLFRGSLREAFRNQIERLGKETQKKLRIRLCFHPELLDRWEFREYLHLECMLVPEWEEEVKEAQKKNRPPKLPSRIRSPFLALNPSIALCRQTLGATVFPEIAPAEPLRLLIAYYNPQNNRLINWLEYLEPMFNAFMSAIDPLRAARFVELHDDQILGDPRSETEPPTKEDILAKLKETNPHVFVFFGHGHEYGEGGLVLGNGTPTDNLLSTELAKTIQEMEDAHLRLVVLPNCETNRMAPALLDAGIPAVVAMQKEILDSPVAEALVDAFCNALFDPLRQFKPLEECVFNVRDRIREMRGEGNVHWFIPTLYLQSEIGLLFASEEEIRLSQYRRFVQEHYNEFPVTIFVKEGMTLESHYVESKVGERQEKQESAGGTEGDLGSEAAPSLEDWRARHERTMVELVECEVQEALKEHPHTVITGEAGDGKSTLLRYLARLYAAENGKGKVKVPILISLRDWAKSGASFEEYLQGGFLSDTGIPQKFGAWLWGKVNSGDAVILLDGLDEVAGAEAQRKIIAQIQTLSSGGGAKDCIIVVTCRKAAYRNQLSGFHTVELLPLKETQIEDYAQRYFTDGKTTITSSRQLRGKAKQFIDLLNTDTRSKALAGNGLMLSLMCFLSDEDSLRLPSSADELYEQVTDNLLKATKKLGLPGRTETVYPAKLKRQVLAEVAFHSLFCGGRDCEPSVGLIDQCIERQTEAKAWEKFAGQEEEILEDIVQNSGLLHPVGPPQTARKYRFFHLTFHEYFAACYIASKVKEERDEAFRRWVFEGGELDCPDCTKKLYPFNHYFWHTEWEETVLLVVGVMKDASLLLRRMEAESQKSYSEKRMLRLFGRAISRCQKPEKELAESFGRELYRLYRVKHSLLSLINAYGETYYEGGFPIGGFPINEYWEREGGSSPHEVEIELERELKMIQETINYSRSALEGSRLSSNSGYLVKLFTDYLKDENNYVRRTAAESLMEIGDTRAVEALMVALKDKDVDVRKAAASALGKIGDARAVPPLIQAFKQDKEGSVRTTVAHALGNIGDARAVPPLIQAFKQDKEGSVRTILAHALVNIGDARAVDTLLAAWQHVTEDNVSVLGWIGRIGDARAVERLVNFLLTDKHSDSFCRKLVSAELGKIGDVSAVRALIVAKYKDRDETVRGCAFSALQKIIDARAVDTFLVALKDKDVDVRRYAAYALGKIGDVSAVDALVNALKDTNEDVREAAAKALGEIGDVSAVDALVAALKDDKSVRKTATEALGKIGDARAIDAMVVALKEALKDKDSDVRKAAAEALGQIGDVSAVDALLTALNDEDDYVRGVVAWALGRISHARVVDPLIRALKDRHKDVRKAAASALVDIGDARTIDAMVVALKEALKDKDSDVRKTAVEALGHIGDVSTVDALVTTLNDKDEDVRKAAAEARVEIGYILSGDAPRIYLGKKDHICQATAGALMKIGDVHSLEALLNVLKDENEDVRRIAPLLWGIGDADAMDALVNALNHEDKSVRRAAAIALGDIGDVGAPGALKITSTDGRYVRKAAAEALVKIGNDSAVDGLVTALNDEDKSVRWAAAIALGKIGDVSAVDDLVTALNDESVRRAVAIALGEIGDVSAVGALVNALKDEERWVREAAAEALGKIGDARAIDTLVIALNDEEVRKAAAEALRNIS